MNLSQKFDVVKIVNTEPRAVALKANTNQSKNLIGMKNKMSLPVPTEEQVETSKMADTTVEESQSDEVFTTYKCNSVPSCYNCIIHPGNIVEAGSLAAQNLPEATYNVLDTLPKETIAEGKISDLQMEGIIFACQRHQLILPDGNRAGFFLGDGTGVGKGRQISGIILDNYCRGRRKHIWFSMSGDLRHDAIRDLTDIGCYTNVIDGCQQLDKGTKAFGLVSEYKEGVLFSTYSTLISSSTKDLKKSNRLEQLINWCGGTEFDGCLIFDESHKAKHFIPGKEKASTKVAIAVTTIQRLLPKARVLYCSATGVTDVKNMAFMERLGLWGIGTTFKDFESFLDSITKRGLGALEMLSMEMKAAGMYVSRGLSYQETEFHTLEASLTTKQIKVYDKAVHVWKELKRSLSIALNRCASANPRIWTTFWGCHQRFFKQLCISMKVPEIIKEAKKAVDEGYSVVIGLQTTGEASLDSELDQNDGNISGFISLTREILKRFILQFFPTERQVPGKESVADEWCVNAKCLLLDFAEKVRLPDSPLDKIIDELGGPANVAEMTGRKGFIGRYKQNEKPRYLTRGGDANSVDSINVNERNAFMNGDKVVAIISDAASTGISIHADKRMNNQRRRVHITAELAWSADKTVQQLGRSHRSNQSSGPIYKLVTSNLGGERRFAAAVAKRLQSLGAITKGDRRAATGADLTQFNFDSNYGRQSLKLMYDAIVQRRLCVGLKFEDIKDDNLRNTYTLDIFHDDLKSCLHDMDILEENVVGPSVQEKNSKNVGKFLNRILGLEVEKQNLIFRYFSKCLDTTTEAAKREGRYNDGVTDIRGNSIVMIEQPKVVFKEAQLGASITRHLVILVDRGIPFTQALEKYNGNRHNESGFFCSKREQYGKKLLLLAIQKERSNHLFTVIRPNTGVSSFEEEKTDLLQKYDRIQPEDVEAGWNDQYDRTKENCIHGGRCKHKGSCKIGSRITELHLLTGRILSILPALEIIVARFAHALQLPREQRNLRVVRIELDNGERMVGLRYPAILINEAEKYIKDQTAYLQETTGQVAQAVVETVREVNNKAKCKVLSAPKTIKNFFKKTSSADKSIRETFENGRSKCDGDVSNNGKRTSDGDVSNTGKRTSDDCAGKAKKLIHSKKRTLSSDVSATPPSKKRKQTNIFSALNTVNQKKTFTCPICQKSLEAMKNDGVNNHIDSCLIE